jgi:hypothetical protein
MNPRVLVDMRAGAAGGVHRQPCGRQDVLGSLPPAGLTSIHPTAEKGNSQKFIFR